MTESRLNPEIALGDDALHVVLDTEHLDQGNPESGLGHWCCHRGASVAGVDGFCCYAPPEKEP